MKKVTVIVATHKPYKMPDYISYLPLHVGAEGKETIGYTGDNTGDNISIDNSMYCELTGLYWLWKNVSSDFKGLVHYRRYFKGKTKSKDSFARVLSDKEIQFLTKRYSVIVPFKRRYYIETLYSHYAHTHYENDLIVTRRVIDELYPEFIPSYDKTIHRTWGYMFNMMIMRSDLMDDYCNWLYTILAEVVKRIDVSDRDDFGKRYPGRISELIFNAWLDYKILEGTIDPSDIAEIPFMYMEKINYVDKVLSFLKAKLFHVRQSKSF